MNSLFAAGRMRPALLRLSVRGFAALLAVAAAALPAVTPRAALAQSGQAQPTLPRIPLTAGIHLIQAEIAADDATRSRGLMFRQSMGTSEGMLFVFARPEVQCFWMRNTLLPLSIAFMEDDGRIVNVADMAPLTETPHCSERPVRYALEMNQGWFAERGIGAQALIGGLPR